MANPLTVLWSVEPITLIPHVISARLSYFKTKQKIGADLHKADVARSKTLLYTTDYGHTIRAILITALSV